MSMTRVGRRKAGSVERALGSVTLGVCVAVSALGAAMIVQACSAAGQTSGRRIALSTTIEIHASATSSFHTAAGWTVTLSKAVLATGPLYYFDGAPPLAQLGRRQRSRQLALQALGLGTAHAHPGHYEQGNALGQMLEPWSADLLAGATELPAGEGVTGVYRSARFTFAAAGAGPMAQSLDGHVALLEGQAEKPGEPTRSFRAVADLADVERSAARGEVDGCRFRELQIEADGRVTVVVQPRVWLELVDFSELAAGAAEEPAEFPPDSQPRIAFAQGLAQLSAYEFSYAASAVTAEE